MPGRCTPVEQPEAPSRQEGQGRTTKYTKEGGNDFACGKPSAVVFATRPGVVLGNYTGLTKLVPLREQYQDHKGSPNTC